MIICYTVLEIWHDECNYFLFWTIFCPFTPLRAKKCQKKKKRKKKKETGDIIILHMCTKIMIT